LRPQGDATLFMVLLAAYKLLLYLCTGQPDILVGTPIANRNRPELEKLVGFFVNSLVIRTDLSHNPTFRQLLDQVHNVSLAAYEHQDLPFEKLVEELRPKRDLSYTPLFQVWFAFQNFSIPSITLPNLTLHPLDVGLRHAQFDLSLLLEEWSEGIRGHFEYNQDLFAAATVARMAEHFKAIIQYVSLDPDIELNTLKELFHEADQQQQAKEKQKYKKKIRQKLKKIKRKSIEEGNR
jgi:non-ribosomal peptide synthetase component F